MTGTGNLSCGGVADRKIYDRRIDRHRMARIVHLQRKSCVRILKK